jgi:hypothetical protein
MSDTPRTDALEKDWFPRFVTILDAFKLCRELERENGRLREYISALEDVCDSDQLKRAQGGRAMSDLDWERT